MILADPQTREEWLRCRNRGIGGSDAACIVGANPWKSARQLWKEKRGIAHAHDLSDNPAVMFGKNAEEHVRELFLLTFPQYRCDYHEFRLYANDSLPWLYATLDGELTGSDGRRGILEIKTTTIQRGGQWDDWDGRVPQHYYIQLLHQLLACSWAEYSILYAHIRYTKADETRATMRRFCLERADVLPDLEELKAREIEFWQHVQDGTEPPYILPEI